MKWLLMFVLAAGPAMPARAQDPPPPLVNRSRVVVPPDVARGDKVRVRVTCGGVLLQFDADAESQGHIGDNVIVRNPENGRRFVARIEEKGKVLVKK